MTVERRRNEFNLIMSSRIGKCDTHTNRNDEQLYSVVRENLQTLPDAGEPYVIGAFSVSASEMQLTMLIQLAES